MAKIKTVTDKDDFKVPLIDGTRFKKLSLEQQQIFEFNRNAILEIFPQNDKGSYDEMTINFAENCAFINLQSFDVILKSVETRIKTLELLIASAQQAAETVTE